MKFGRNILQLSDKWVQFLVNQPETGMGYQVCTIRLRDGRDFKQAIVDSGLVTKIKDTDGIPFSEDEIDEIIVTHDKWQ